MPGGTRIESELPKCDAVVFSITTNSVEFAYVQQEVWLARAHGELMVPLADDRVDKGRLGLVGELEWLEIDLDDPSEAFLRVTPFLQSLVFAQSRNTERASRTAPGGQDWWLERRPIGLTPGALLHGVAQMGYAVLTSLSDPIEYPDVHLAIAGIDNLRKAEVLTYYVAQTH